MIRRYMASGWQNMTWAIQWLRERSAWVLDGTWILQLSIRSSYTGKDKKKKTDHRWVERHNQQPVNLYKGERSSTCTADIPVLSKLMRIEFPASGSRVSGASLSESRDVLDLVSWRVWTKSFLGDQMWSCRRTIVNVVSGWIHIKFNCLLGRTNEALPHCALCSIEFGTSRRIKSTDNESLLINMTIKVWSRLYICNYWVISVGPASMYWTRQKPIYGRSRYHTIRWSWA